MTTCDHKHLYDTTPDSEGYVVEKCGCGKINRRLYGFWKEADMTPRTLRPGRSKEGMGPLDVMRFY